MMETTARYAHEDATWFIKLGGDVRHSVGPALNALLDRALADPHTSRFVIDLSQADTIDSTCLGILARVANHALRNKTPRPVIITGEGDIAEVLLAVCFDQLFDLVSSADTPDGALQPIPGVTLSESHMLSLVLEAHRRLCAIDERTHAVFRDLVEALEQERSGVT